MSGELEIYESGHIIYYKFADPWTVAEAVATFDKDKIHRDSVNFKVHTLINLCDMHAVPPKILSVRFGSPALSHPNSGHIAVFGAQPIVRTFADAVLLLTHFDRAKFFSTEDEAWAYIRQIMAKEKSQAN
jgi:hypothetical protein